MSDQPDLRDVVLGLSHKVEKLADEKVAKPVNRWASRKFLVAVVGSASLVLADVNGVKLSPETLASIVTLAGLFIGGEAFIDSKGR